jgi:hypothetical protein
MGTLRLRCVLVGIVLLASGCTQVPNFLGWSREDIDHETRVCIQKSAERMTVFTTVRDVALAAGGCECAVEKLSQTYPRKFALDKSRIDESYAEWIKACDACGVPR